MEWGKEKLQDFDRRTRKLLMMNGGFHPRNCMGRLYVPRAKGGRILSLVEDCVEQARKSLESVLKITRESCWFQLGRIIRTLIFGFTRLDLKPVEYLLVILSGSYFSLVLFCTYRSVLIPIVS